MAVEEDDEVTPVMEEDLEIPGVGNIDVFENSMCMYCHGSGKTRMLMHKVPYFREIIISSFRCDDCHDINTEVSFGGEIQVHGCKYRLKVISEKDLDRQLIKSDSASIRVEELDLEIPPKTQQGEISTIEGFLRTAAKNLGISQEHRMAADPVVGAQVATVIAGLNMMAMGERIPFTITVDDPAGNSFIQNPVAPAKDPNMTTAYYQRTAEQSIAIGLQPERGEYKDDRESNFPALAAGSFGKVKTADGEKSKADGDEEVLGRTEAVSLPSPCPNCNEMGEVLTALTDIPHFKEVIIMSFTCKVCGYRNNEVKGGGAIPTKGTEITLTVRSEADLHRDVLKSDSCAVAIPQLELEMQHGSLGGVYTTVEGLLDKVRTNLREGNPFAIGDSSVNNHSEQEDVTSTKAKFLAFMVRLENLGKQQSDFPFDIVMRDPLGNSFFSPRLGEETAPADDDCLAMVDFKRTWDEDEQFGLNDINTRDFETGVDYGDDDEVVLPDRITHVLPKGADHPHVFAKGMDDEMGGGVYRGAVEGAKSQREKFLKLEPEDEGIVEQTGAASAVAVSEEAAAAYEGVFEASATFAGARPGMAFKMGVCGLGYYTDKPMGVE